MNSQNTPVPSFGIPFTQKSYPFLKIHTQTLNKKVDEIFTSRYLTSETPLEKQAMIYHSCLKELANWVDLWIKEKIISKKREKVTETLLIVPVGLQFHYLRSFKQLNNNIYFDFYTHLYQTNPYFGFYAGYQDYTNFDPTINQRKVKIFLDLDHQ